MSFTIYFTSDTHGYLYPTDFLTDDEKPMGLLGVAPEKDGDTLLIDGGDTLQGSPLSYMLAREGDTSPFSNALNARGYDYVTIGNHDFNYGTDALKRYLHALDAECLCANVSGAGLPCAPYALKVMKSGLRVGLVGVTTSFIPVWEAPEHLTGVTVSDALSAARNAAEKLSALRPDVWIGIYHGGVERDLTTGRLLSDTDENIACRLCEQLPFDLLLTGHQHIAIEQGVWHGTRIVQTPANARAYARVTRSDTGAFTCELLAPPPPKLTKNEQALKRRLYAFLKTPIGRLPRALPVEDRLTMAMNGSSIADLVNLAQLAVSKADVSCTALANDVRGFQKDVTVWDVVASYPYANTLCVLSVTGDTLRRALEQCATYFDVRRHGEITVAEPFLRPKEAHYNYDFFMGVEYTFDLAKPEGSRVVRLTKNNIPVQNEDVLTLCMNSYRATGAGGFDVYAACPRVREIQTEVSEILLSYLSENADVQLPDAHAVRVTLP